VLYAHRTRFAARRMWYIPRDVAPQRDISRVS
jgi:hypothetical protein